jgi:exopolyphosphatase/guanosine-5'-triphosphate,3'-diphosphate pyrophosphatase
VTLRLTEAQELAIERVLETSDWEIGHVHHVRRIATWLFDALRELHGLSAGDELLLHAAALLHDVGYPVDAAEHHKVSARIIRNLLGSPFHSNEVDLIALLARYHRKAIPKLRHRRYGALDGHERRVVTWLGGILRVADGLDRGHDSAVQWLSTAIHDERLEIRVSDRPPLRANGGDDLAFRSETAERLQVDLDGAMRKRDLLERAIGRPVIVRPF